MMETQLQNPEVDSLLAQAVNDRLAELRMDLANKRYWIRNDHGRLCWNFFRGGLPIGRHFCQLEEGHEGHHCDEEGGWIEGSRF
ncbi:hypothetical protein SH661x_000394 [Planctomicrobium sp. SH661]|uniref:hypothetical protein n=1 Tax=Planctomicrobium sp. SH661 TaxID=3448124 RepID=UPI003F5CAE47